jgi:hypothetical protein
MIHRDVIDSRKMIHDTQYLADDSMFASVPSILAFTIHPSQRAVVERLIWSCARTCSSYLLCEGKELMCIRLLSARVLNPPNLVHAVGYVNPSFSLDLRTYRTQYISRGAPSQTDIAGRDIAYFSLAIRCTSPCGRSCLSMQGFWMHYRNACRQCDVIEQRLSKSYATMPLVPLTLLVIQVFLVRYR